VAAEPLLAAPAGGYAQGRVPRPVTRFERQGLDRGHVVRDVMALRRR
jgi:hypothetical protein